MIDKRWAVIGFDGTLFAIKETRPEAFRSLVEEYPSAEYYFDGNGTQRKRIIEPILDQTYYIVPYRRIKEVM